MKILLLTLCFVAIFCYLINSTDATTDRQKRWAGREMCPEHRTRHECIEYAKQKSKNFKYCNGFTVGGKFNYIEWQNCVNVKCSENRRLIPEDLSKPYPDCCKHCVDDS